jgi:phosphatidylserine decarboxylase
MNQRHGFLPFAKDGWRFILPLAALTVAAFFMSWILGCVVLALTAFVTYFFRDPERDLPAGDNIAVSPADGKVIFINEIDHPNFPRGRAKKVGIFLSVLDVHVNRAPLRGEIVGVRYSPGKFHNALFDKSSDENEHNVIALNTNWGYIEVKQIAGAIARRIVCNCEKGGTLERGQRYGLIRFGSRTEVCLPVETEIWVNLGDRVRGGATPIGRVAANAKAS